MRVSYTSEMLHELNVLVLFNLDTMHEGLKIHASADPEVVAAARRLHERGLVSQVDGGYLTPLGRDAAEHAQSLLDILASG